MEKSIPLQIDLSRLDRASAIFVEQLVEYALQLHQSLTSECKPIIHRMKIPLNVTWCTILRSQYFIVASASVEESRLTLWRLEGALQLCAEYYVSGPIVNGLVFDADDMVVIGLTVGSTYVLCIAILSFRFTDLSDLLERSMLKSSVQEFMMGT